MKKALSTDKAPAAIGPYSQGMGTGNFAFVSGQLPADPVSGKFPETIEAQTEACLGNIEAILKSGGLSRKDIVKTTIFLTNMADFIKVNAAYGAFFEGCVFPARSTIQVAALPKNAPIEIEAIAFHEQA
ncbi:Rid family detoxifying hydrolase [Leadbettera azotonutricia]|uniref:Putative endoribonuclease L-PSP n=1 Tax=Leadbettera azotonutricia (strain ATCC BAA-888 / DSM 13862 / ZAS-9) TaxID=545695 RepID=F5YBK5_LEAAZ|nr:Rid family detoxifying hydrolase [Leadbettera azotonutricia]AEF80411.1 putative endoribonuclease L-PSP [Leadbettera azotonutricia ZAS-9]